MGSAAAPARGRLRQRLRSTRLINVFAVKRFRYRQPALSSSPRLGIYNAPRSTDALPAPLKLPPGRAHALAQAPLRQTAADNQLAGTQLPGAADPRPRPDRPPVRRCCITRLYSRRAPPAASQRQSVSAINWLAIGSRYQTSPAYFTVTLSQRARQPVVRDSLFIPAHSPEYSSSTIEAEPQTLGGRRRPPGNPVVNQRLRHQDEH